MRRGHLQFGLQLQSEIESNSWSTCSLYAVNERGLQSCYQFTMVSVGSIAALRYRSRCMFDDNCLVNALKVSFRSSHISVVLLLLLLWFTLLLPLLPDSSSSS